MKKFTWRNHYNPCFWTALWNPIFYDAFVTSSSKPGEPREQRIYQLNVHADRILSTKFDNVHFHKDLGVAEITPESMKRYYKRNRPSDYNDFCNYLKKHPESLFIDFEETLTGIEQVGGYDSLLDAVLNGGLTSAEHKGYLSIVLIIHAMRSYEMMTSMVEYAALDGMDKWEYFLLLKDAWADAQLLARAVTPIAQGRWTFYKTTKHKFPICDSPVLINKNSVMAILSPRLLLEIDLTVHKDESYWEVKEGIHFSKYREFRRRAINNTFNDILFHDVEELEQWRKLPEFKKRCGIINDAALRKTELKEAAERVIFALSGFGRVPDGIVFPV